MVECGGHNAVAKITAVSRKGGDRNKSVAALNYKLLLNNRAESPSISDVRENDDSSSS